MSVASVTCPQDKQWRAATVQRFYTGISKFTKQYKSNGNKTKTYKFEILQFFLVGITQNEIKKLIYKDDIKIVIQLSCLLGHCIFYECQDKFFHACLDLDFWFIHFYLIFPVLNLKNKKFLYYFLVKFWLKCWIKECVVLLV